MRVFRHPDSLPSSARGAVVALGNFDGVHRGHQAVLAEAARRAKTLDAPFAVMTFFPHPREWFDPGVKPLNLYPLREKLRLLADSGADAAFVLRFDAALARMTAAEFASRILAQSLGARHVVTGEDFRFGKGREGSAAFLASAAGSLHFGYTPVPHVEGVSSSRIREALAEGRVEEASALLGRPYAISGHVIFGASRGRELGAPTANLALSAVFRPAYGVYAIEVLLPDGRRFKGVANCGVRPSFGGGAPLLEAHCFGLDQALYGMRLEVRLLRFLRPERVFADADALKVQIAEDMRQARAIVEMQ